MIRRLGIKNQIPGQAPFVGPNVVNANGTQNPTNTGPRLVLDGSVPMISANDGTYLRAQMGNLANYVGPNGVTSPAQYGFRAVDQTGNAIFDSLGLIAVMKNIGLASYSNTSSTNTAYTDISPILTGSTSFTLTRQTNVLAIAMLYGITAGAVGSRARYALRIGTATQSTDWGSATTMSKVQTDYTNGTLFYFASIPAGNWDAGIQCGVDSGQTCTTWAAVLALFSMGA